MAMIYQKHIISFSVLSQLFASTRPLKTFYLGVDTARGTHVCSDFTCIDLLNFNISHIQKGSLIYKLKLDAIRDRGGVSGGEMARSEWGGPKLRDGEEGAAHKLLRHTLLIRSIRFRGGCQAAVIHADLPPAFFTQLPFRWIVAANSRMRAL